MGIVADKIGLKPIFIAGLGLFATVYFGMSLNGNVYIYTILFLIYGLYAAATEGISKAWISNITDRKDTATAIGLFAGFQSICTMFASSFAGIIWYTLGASVMFITTAGVTVLVIFYFLFSVPTSVSTKANRSR
jgi:MFS family permease